MRSPRSYLLCGTPRTGSTLLCSLLASTGVAGHPESYFREPDQHLWARRFGVLVAADGSFDYNAFVAGAVRLGSTPNGAFAARVMWGTMHLMVDGLNPERRAQTDLRLLADAFGPLGLVHLGREDVIGQSVSWARAEQTGYWQHGDVSLTEPHLDLDQIDDLVRTIREHDMAWRTWFRAQAAQPLFVTYEELVADPGRTVERILDFRGCEPPPGWRPESPNPRQADETNREWVRRCGEMRR